MRGGPVPAELNVLDEHLRAPAAPIVAFAATRRKIVRHAEAESTLLHEIIDRLGGQAKKPVHAARPRLRLGVLHELGADPLVLVLRIDADASQFRLVLVGIGMQRQAGYLGAIDLEDEKSLELAINLRP